MEKIEIIKAAGLKLTPQRKAVYEAMMELRHAQIEAILSLVQQKVDGITVSTVYRILDSFCKAQVLSRVCHPETGKCYYDIKVNEHHHLFDGQTITDYDDPELSRLIRQYLEKKSLPLDHIDKVQVQITIHNSLTPK